MTTPDPGATTNPAPRMPRILVVDDHEMGRNSLARLLGVLGYEVVAVKDGVSAIERMGQDTRFDYVLTDLRLPDLDGREVVQAADALVPRPWIALITGWDVEAEEVERLKIDCVFLKPLDVMAIVDRLKQSPPADLEGDAG